MSDAAGAIIRLMVCEFVLVRKQITISTPYYVKLYSHTNMLYLKLLDFYQKIASQTRT
jgi:intergrase/recombinase